MRKGAEKRAGAEWKKEKSASGQELGKKKEIVPTAEDLESGEGRETRVRDVEKAPSRRARRQEGGVDSD